MSDSIIHSKNAPEPVGEYPHARRVGQLLFLSGVGSRIPGSNEIPGGPICDPDGVSLAYDVAAQTEQVIKNIEAVLSSCNLTLANVVDVTAFLVDMDRDFEAYNKVYAKYFNNIQAARTTIAIRALPTPIAVEFKLIAAFPS
jgi:2-aminomuconate deaminase